ncbi:GTP-binding domain [Vibrio phage D479]
MFNPRILVTGGRDYKNYKLVHMALNKLYNDSNRIGTMTVIEGGATGADRFAGDWAKDAIEKKMAVNLITVPAEWDRLGPKAGYVRNKYMASCLQPDICLAFPGGKGTRNMIEICTEQSIRVYKFCV